MGSLKKRISACERVSGPTDFHVTIVPRGLSREAADAFVEAERREHGLGEGALHVVVNRRRHRG